MSRPHVLAFAAGLIVGLVILSLAGHATANASQYDAFVRFHRAINPESLFYPTASQVTAVAREAAPEDQTLVIVGGSSPLFGSGQGGAELWSVELERLLGEHFGVVNLAFPGGAPGEHGSVAAQALIQEGRDVVFVTQVFPSRSDGDGNVHRYVVWDALARGMLLPSAERDALLAEDGPLAETRMELRIRSNLDRLLAVTDLWQVIGYRVGFTTWQPLADPVVPWWGPRDRAADPAPGILPVNPNYVVDNDATFMRETVAQTALWCEQRDGVWYHRPDAAADRLLRRRVAAQIPPGLRERTVAMVTMSSPRWVSRLPASAQACRLEHLRGVRDRLRADGYHTVLVGEGWEDADFVDPIHQSGAGGRKMAEAVAPLVRELAGR